MTVAESVVEEANNYFGWNKSFVKEHAKGY